MSHKQKVLVLVDGSSYLFRAYHALPSLTTSKGLPTGAAYGVLNMLRKLLKEYQPDYIAVVFDTKAKTFRHEMYEDYKANRPEMPEELAVQIKPLHEVIEAQGLPLLMMEGYEADDIIGTLAKQAAKHHIKTIISTGDKDFAQIVDANTVLVNTMSNTIMDEKGVVEKFGVKPEQIIDYLALVGDAVDNVPGIPKVGPKTAAKWLQEYGTIEDLIKNADKISGVVGENLRNNLDRLATSRKLVTIHNDVPLKQTVENLVQSSQETEKLRALFQELEFNSWLRELNQGAAESYSLTTEGSKHPAPEGVKGEEKKSSQSSVHYECILEEAQFAQWLAKLEQAGQFVIDTETDNLDAMAANLVGISLSTTSHEGAYIPVGHSYENCPKQLPLKQVLAKLKPLLESDKKIKIAQNLKYDLQVLRNYDIEIKQPVMDTMLESYVLQSTASRHDMDSLALKYLNYTTISYNDVTGKGAKQITFDKVELEKAVPYSSEDADITLRLHEVLWPEIEDKAKLKWVFEQIEMPLVYVLTTMERNGVMIDVVKLEEQSKTLAIRIKELEEEVYRLAGEVFNLSSPKQLQEILFTKLKLPVLEKTPTGQPSTGESVLQELSAEYELPKFILEYRSLSKLKSTYTDRLPETINPKTERVHTSYHQAVTATGRLSSSDPNLQNIPIRTEEGRKIRQAFIAPKGFVILAADYSQIELRIMAHLSQDPGLLKAFNHNIDIHTYTASEVFGVKREAVTAEQRRGAKAINFGLLYGMSAFGLAKQLGISREEAQIYIKHYFHRYPKVKEYMESTKEYAAKHGYVETLCGRRLYLPEIKSKNGMRRMAAERAAINAPMQGTAADLIKLAMIAVHDWSTSHTDKVKMIMQVHDELVFEVAHDFIETAKNAIEKRMQNALKIDVPLEVSIGTGKNWDEAH